jgi:hypothetical protein
MSDTNADTNVEGMKGISNSGFVELLLWLHIVVCTRFSAQFFFEFLLLVNSKRAMQLLYL